MKHPEILALPLLMLADYTLTLIGARLREKGYADRFRVEHYELNSLWQRDVAAQRWVNPRFLVAVLLLPAALIWLDEQGSLRPSVFRFGSTLLLVSYAVIFARHLTAIFEFRHVARHPDAVTGSVRMSHPFVMWQSARQLLCLALPLAVIAFLAPSPTTLGAVAGVGVLLLAHGFWGWRVQTSRKVLALVVALTITSVAIFFLGRSSPAERSYGRGAQLWSIGDHDTALDEFELAAQQAPDWAMAHWGVGSVLIEIDRNEEALAAFDRAVELEPDWAEAHYGRCCALARLDRHAESVAAARRTLELDAEHEWARNFIEEVERVSGG